MSNNSKNIFYYLQITFYSLCLNYFTFSVYLTKKDKHKYIFSIFKISESKSDFRFFLGLCLEIPEIPENSIFIARLLDEIECNGDTVPPVGY